MLYIAYTYKKEDCDCKYCLYYSHGKCKLPWCCCYEDKVRTGSPFTKDMHTEQKAVFRYLAKKISDQEDF